MTLITGSELQGGKKVLNETAVGFCGASRLEKRGSEIGDKCNLGVHFGDASKGRRGERRCAAEDERSDGTGAPTAEGSASCFPV